MRGRRDWTRIRRAATGAALLALAFGGAWAHGAEAAAPRPRPRLVSDPAEERTGFQEASPWDGAFDFRTDFVMAYGIGAGVEDRLDRWKRAGYVPHLMTGVAWGEYQDYLDGKIDGREHWDEAQRNAADEPILHGPRVPYMVPTVAFSDYLRAGVQRAIAAGAVAIHLEEPEFWADGGYSQAFRREWEIFYREPWQRPDSSCDAQYRASRLKSWLYRRALSRLCDAMKEYSAVHHDRVVRFYVPTHSLLNYAQWRIVSPEGALIDLSGVDGYIAQVWTGTARTPNVYAGRVAERTFETAFLEYGVMQELVRGTGRRMWFLADPIEDNPRHDWDDYRRNWRATLIASLLHPDVSRYEVCPWPSRVVRGRYPRGRRDARRIPADYATVLAIVFQQLRDMEQDRVEWPEATTGVGVFLSDTAMFQRSGPAFTEGLAKESEDPDRPTAREVRSLAGFYGLALPPLKRGVPVRPVQLDNVARFPGYLDPYRVLVLSYEFQKPESPGIHIELARWVRRGGSLVYVGADTDPFHRVREWWSRAPGRYTTPSEHLFEVLDLDRRVGEGEHRCGRGRVLVLRSHPAAFSRSPQAAARLVSTLNRGVEAAGGRWLEQNRLLLRRGPYVIAATLEESTGDEPLVLGGLFVDLLRRELPVVRSVRLPPGEQAFLLDLERTTDEPALPLASAGRIESWEMAPDSVRYLTRSPDGIEVTTRIRLPATPTTCTVDGAPATSSAWDSSSKTLFLAHPGRAEGVRVEIEWTSPPG